MLKNKFLYFFLFNSFVSISWTASTQEISREVICDALDNLTDMETWQNLLSDKLSAKGFFTSLKQHHLMEVWYDKLGELDEDLMCELFKKHPLVLEVWQDADWLTCLWFSQLIDQSPTLQEKFYS